MRKGSAFKLVYAITLCQLSSFADSVDDMEHVVVTGTRTPLLITDSPVKVDVVNTESIEAVHAQNASEAVKQLNGVQLQKVTGKEGFGAMLQGITADKVLVLIDGEPVSASTGSTADLTQIGLAGIERIEVVKGPVSVLYGSAAIGGVINIITATPEAGFHGNFKADVGSYLDENTSGESTDWGKARFNGLMSFANEYWQWKGDLNLEENQGFMAGIDDWTQPGPDGHRISTNLSGRYSPTETQSHQLSVGYYQQENHTRFKSEPKPGETNPDLIKQDKQDDATRKTLKYRSRFEGESTQLQLFANTESYRNESIPTRSNFRKADSAYHHIGVQFDQMLTSQNITLGLDTKRQELEQTLDKPGSTVQEIEPVSFDTIEAYAQDDFEWLGMQLLPGLRWHFDSDFGHDLTPKINGRYDVIDDGEALLFIRGGVGRGYRVPNLKERYYLFDHSQLGYMIQGNPDLEPETSISYQLGLSFHWLDTIKADVQFFYNDLNKLIAIELLATDTNEGIDLYQYQNIEKARTKGLEINTQWLIDSGFKINLGYSYLDAEDLTLKRRLANRAKHQFKAQLNKTLWQGSEALIAYRFKTETYQYDAIDGRYTTPEYDQIDLKFNQALGDSFGLYAGVENLLDVRKDFNNTQDTRPDVGRYAYLGLKYQW